MACERTHVDDTSYRRLVVKEKEAISHMHEILQMLWKPNCICDFTLVRQFEKKGCPLFFTLSRDVILVRRIRYMLYDTRRRLGEIERLLSIV